MSIPAKYLIRTILAAGIAAGLCAALLFASAGQAAGGKTQTLRFFDKVVFTKHTAADGTVVTREPQAGDVLDVISLEFAGNHARHAKKPSGTSHLRCTFVAPAGPPDCVSHVAFGGSMLVFEGFPGTLVLGTGRYVGATGRVISNKDVGGNNSDIVARITLR
jgi:hypothetical protein